MLKQSRLKIPMTPSLLTVGDKLNIPFVAINGTGNHVYGAITQEIYSTNLCITKKDGYFQISSFHLTTKNHVLETQINYILI